MSEFTSKNLKFRHIGPYEVEQSFHAYEVRTRSGRLLGEVEGSRGDGVSISSFAFEARDGRRGFGTSRIAAVNDAMSKAVPE